ncbi:hypothetical protein Clacol_004333 [Clathrus columnatus]|uniref:Uncharacterized protein n=1 Tax=Clathrus columnatus TaxID=1419009 RepID=A0AAV5A983_9AGAM|nr:hypothetical protein Clacol_004333 [Clathrus columnatus]
MFSFALFVSITTTLTVYTIGENIVAFQNVYALNKPLLNGFETVDHFLQAFDLRRRNANKTILNQSDLPDFNLSFQDPMQSMQSVLGRVHQSIIADMGERNDPVLGVDDPTPGQGEPNEETA